MSEGSHLSSNVRQRAAVAVVNGMAIADVATAYSVNRKTVSRWVIRFRDCGREGLQRKVGSGRPPKLEELTESELRRIILSGAMAAGFETDLWSVGRLRRVISDTFRVR